MRGPAFRGCNIKEFDIIEVSSFLHFQFSMLLVFLFIQEVDGVYSCMCPEGFTGEKCSTEVPTNASPRPTPQNREGSGGMSTAAIAGIVAGIVLAALICCMVLTALVVCVRLRKKKKSKYYTTSTQFPESCNIFSVCLIALYACFYNSLSL